MAARKTLNHHEIQMAKLHQNYSPMEKKDAVFVNYSCICAYAQSTASIVCYG